MTVFNTKQASLVAVVIPAYKRFHDLSRQEVESLKQIFKVLRGRQIVLFGETDIDWDNYKKVGACEGVSEIKVEIFDDGYFKSIKGYNALMLSPEFYQRFNAFMYVLICQLDAWVFQDDLTNWCRKGYDYIGAPWINWEWSSFYARHLTFPRRFAYRLGYRKFNLVGNGGFSLRKVKSAVSNLERFRKAANNFELNEDYFFSFYVTSFNPFFRIPPVSEALKFCFDEHPEQAFALAKEQLPMACHAWVKNIGFWRDYINVAN